ncbi:MAG: PCMD domain-containing protein [Duncaniella sp.]|nr:PCMD domain-containing protein [Duncaniella sp.]
MKTFLQLAAALILGISATGCREENSVLTSNGRMKLTTSVMSEIRTASRALSEEENNALAASALIWVSDNDDKCLFKFNGLDKFPSEGLPLSPGRYLAEAWVGDSVPASWDKKRYYGVERFDIAAGADKQVNLQCTVRNTLVSVTPSSQLKEVLNDMSITVSLNDGITDGSHSLVFSEAEGTLGQTGYFMVNSRTKGFKFTIEGNDVNGNAVKISRDYTDETLTDDPHGLARATHYKFAVRYSDMTSEIQIGGVYFELDVEADPVEGTQEPIVITLAPTIVDLDGYDLNETIMGTPGEIDRLALYISASTTLKEVEITSSLLEKFLGEGQNVVGWPRATEDYYIKLQEAGIYLIEYPDKVEGLKGVANFGINFSAPYMNTLGVGEYTITVKAVDDDNRSTVKEIHLHLDNAPGQITNMVPSSDLSYTSSVLKATVRNAGKDMYFEVKEAAGSRAYEDWTRVNGTYDSARRTLTATATGLKDGTEYQYRLVIDDYTSQEKTFETPAYPQLENGGFEDWYNGAVTPSDKDAGWFPISAPDNIFWDCGNHGSLTLGGNITNRTTDVHSGSYAIEMKSQFVGIATIGKFAAGNVFYGKYLKTDGTDGELGFGRPFPDVHPKQLKGWVKYHPEAISDKKEYNALPAGAELGAGDNDQGEIYIALLSADTSVQGDPSYPDYPVVVKTKSKKFFDPQGSNVIAYGKKNFDELTSWTEFTIDLRDVNPNQKVAYIMVVCTASRYGDYFAGGRGSTMWLDDLKLVY